MFIYSQVKTQMPETYFSKEYTTANNINAGEESAETFISEDDVYASGPFDQITVTNSDSVTLRINLDKSARTLTVPPGYFHFNLLKFKTFSITNMGVGGGGTGTHTAGKIKFLVENTQFPRRS